jgi:hypothetical protein
MSKTLRIAAFLFVAIIAIGCAIYYCFTKNSNNEEAAKKEKVAEGPAEAGKFEAETSGRTPEGEPGNIEGN